MFNLIQWYQYKLKEIIMSRQTYMKTYNDQYKKSYKGSAYRIYHHQVRNAKQRNHELPNYTKDEFYEWYISNDAHIKLHDAWVASGCNKELTPSADRLDNAQSYTLDNLELVTWQENKQRAYKDIQQNKLSNSGLLNDGHTAVCQYSLDGTKIADYFSLQEAKRQTGIDHRGISDCCRGKRNVFHGYLWCYAVNQKDFEKTLTATHLTDLQQSYKKRLGLIVEIELFNNQQLMFSTIKSAAEHFNVSSHVFNCWAYNKSTNRTPQKPKNIKTITIKEKIT